MKPNRLKRFTLRLGSLVAALVLYWWYGRYAIHSIVNRGGSVWVPISESRDELPDWLRIALDSPVPDAELGSLNWEEIGDGLWAADVEVRESREHHPVDALFLIKIDSRRYIFTLGLDASGSKSIADWQKSLGAAVVVNGSYFDMHGAPATPTRFGGIRYGPKDYTASHGAFLLGAHAAIVDLENRRWQDLLTARDGFVSYPLLVTDGHIGRAKGESSWLANRTFAAVDAAGNIVLGVTKNAHFSLERLGRLLADPSLGFIRALNLDGGPVSCQAVHTARRIRTYCGRWETRARDGELQLLKPLRDGGQWGLPIVIAAVKMKDATGRP